MSLTFIGFGVEQGTREELGCQKGMGTCVRARLQPAVKTSQNRMALAAVFEVYRASLLPKNSG
jgi:hypothetical protein